MAAIKIKSATKLKAWVNAMPGPGMKPRLHIIGTIEAPNPGAFPYGVDGGFQKSNPPVHLVEVKNIQVPGNFPQVITDQPFHYSKGSFDLSCKKVKLTLWTGKMITLAISKIV